MIMHLTQKTQMYTVLRKLKSCTGSLFTWFKEHHMKTNGDKCHLLVTTEKPVSSNFGGGNVTNKKYQKLLGIRFDSSLLFEGQITSLCERSMH